MSGASEVIDEVNLKISNSDKNTYYKFNKSINLKYDLFSELIFENEINAMKYLYIVTGDLRSTDGIRYSPDKVLERIELSDECVIDNYVLM